MVICSIRHVEKSSPAKTFSGIRVFLSFYHFNICEKAVNRTKSSYINRLFRTGISIQLSRHERIPCVHKILLAKYVKQSVNLLPAILPWYSNKGLQHFYAPRECAVKISDWI
jgi:hypothetical protein